MVRQMARPKLSSLPRFLNFHPPNQTYYYKNPGMVRKANLGKEREQAVQTAVTLNKRYAIETAQAARRLEFTADLGGCDFGSAFAAFVGKYCDDYRLKASTRQRLMQRSTRLASRLTDIQLGLVDTQMLREAIEVDSSYEQTKMRTVLRRFFQFAKSRGEYPQHLPNPVDDLYVDPSPEKRRRRMTLDQFQAIHDASPQWLRTMMILGLHLALRRVDLVNLRFDDVQEDRIVSPIRKTDTRARAIEATSVSFPIHPDVRHAINTARISSIKTGRCPFIVHRNPERRTGRQKDALGAGRMEHPAQVLPEYASKAFAKARARASRTTGHFEYLEKEELPTLHEIRSLSSYLYARSGFTTEEVKDLMAHTDPDMTRAYQRGHARKVLQVQMMLPRDVLAPATGGTDSGSDLSVRDQGVRYRVWDREKKFSQNFLSATAVVTKSLF